MNDAVKPGAVDTLSRDAPVFQPLRAAFWLVFAYILLCGAYIAISDVVAARHAESVEELQRIETVKGTVFIIVTGAGLFGLSWGLLTLIARQETELLRRRNALLESERRATAGLLAASVAHDINNVLTALQCDIDELGQATELAADHRPLVLQMTAAVDDLSVLVRRLMATGKKELPGEFVEVDLVGVVREALAFIQTHSRARGCRVSFESRDGLMMRANPTIVRQMLANLVLNAADATGEKGQILVRLYPTDKDAVLEVHDNGPGIPVERRAALFTELSSTKPNGSGLGLLSVKVYAEAHQGRVEVVDGVLGGAGFRVTLPLHERARHGLLAEVF